MKWSGPDLTLAVECLGQCSEATEAAKKLTTRLRALGRIGSSEAVTYDMLKHAFRTAKMSSPSAYLGQPRRYSGAKPPDFDEDAVTVPRATPAPERPRDTEPAPPLEQPSGDPGEFARLLAATRKGPVSFADLCDALDMSPKRTRELVEAAQDAGLRVSVAHDHVGIAPDRFDDRIQSVGIAPVVGERQTVGVISDLHFGSKYCLRDQIREFVLYAYHECGVREILGPGDNVDGIYKHGIWEVSHLGIDAQADDMLDTLPQLPGLNYRCITGNHDETHEDGNGLDFGSYITNRARLRGRGDIHYYGRRSAFLRVGGAVVHLWHPRGSAAYAKSYRLQKVIEKYSSGEKPHILLVGHFHQYCHLFDRGVHAFLCPTFQGGGSAFGNSLGGAPAIGGMVLSWDMTADGTMRRFVHEYRAYFEVERPHQVDDETAFREEMPIR